MLAAIAKKAYCGSRSKHGGIRVSKETPQSKGGKARASSLSKAERSEIARQGAAARWNLPKATHEGELHIAGIDPLRILKTVGVYSLAAPSFKPSEGRGREHISAQSAQILSMPRI